MVTARQWIGVLILLTLLTATGVSVWYYVTMEDTSEASDGTGANGDGTSATGATGATSATSATSDADVDAGSAPYQTLKQLTNDMPEVYTRGRRHYERRARKAMAAPPSDTSESSVIRMNTSGPLMNKLKRVVQN